jgi:cobalt transporter subunit CbtA
VTVLRRILTTALMAGLVAGIVVSIIQYLAVHPLIVEAERFEARAAAVQAAPAAARTATEAATEAEPWQPQDGVERTAYILLANLLTGIGFAMLLGGGFAIYGGRVDTVRGMYWGIAGFLTFALAPALGLPPEPPGVPAADLVARQGWWLGTVFATATGLAAVVFARHPVAKAAGVMVMVLPHLIGAPHLAGAAATIPADLATSFVIASLATTALFWLVLGAVSGAFYRRFA